MVAFSGKLDDPVEVNIPITELLVQIEQHAAAIMEMSPSESEVYNEANEIESKAGYIAGVLAGEEV